jgi:transposase
MVLAVRRGTSLRRAAALFGVALGTVQHWVQRAARQRLGRVDFSDHPKGSPRAVNRTTRRMERQILALRSKLKSHSVLGQHGARAIHEALLEKHARGVPSVRTIGRILERHGAVDGRRRVRRCPPPKGWYLPELAARKADVDSFDTVTDLSIKGGGIVTTLNGISLHGGLTASWPEARVSSKTVEKHLLSHWRQFGLPGYAKFDNDVIFQGPHQWADSFGRITRLCLQLDVTPIFAPPREPGFQAEIEAFNGRWQRAVWRRFVHKNLAQLQDRTQQFLSAARRQAACRIGIAAERRPFPGDFTLDYQRPLKGRVIFLRRTNAQAVVECLGHRFKLHHLWVHRLVRIEVDLTFGEMRFYRLRRLEPEDQPLLKTLAYRVIRKPFHD